MLIHSVYFWLKPGVAPAESQRFGDALRSLAKIGAVRRTFIGPPAATPARGPVDASWSTALIVWFDDVAGHDAYQADPIHERFVRECSPLWTRVLVLDAHVDDKAERLGE